MSKIIFNNLEFYAFHGVIPAEQKIGSRYLVDIEIKTDLSKASETDNLKDTIDYSLIYKFQNKIRSKI